MTCPSCGSALPQPDGTCPTCGESTVTRNPVPNLGSFEVLRPLGEGGMGAVFLAKNRQLHRLVAVKLLSDRVADDDDARERFSREARSMARVEHPNIARIYSFGKDGEHTYIEMEFVDGESLAGRLARSGRMSVEEAVPIVLQVVSALEFAVSKGIVHRDVKPSNVLLTRSHEVRVADFGLAKPAVGHEDSAITGTGALIGTPSYISPEQARGEPADHRSDIYSLGVMMYEMLSGEKPFQGPTPVAVVAKHLHEPLPSLERAAPGVPAELARLIERMTAKDPASRLASYEELRKILASLRPGSGESRREPGLLGGRGGIFLAATGIVALVAFGGFLSLRRTSELDPASVAVQMEKLTSRGTVRDPILSPDARYLAYISDEGGPAVLWLRDVGERTEVALVDPIDGEYAQAHFFSRDGAHVYFSAVPAGRDSRRLYRIPLIGGQARIVGDGSWPDLSPDGERILYWRAEDEALVITDGLTIEEIATVPGRRMEAVWSSGGDRVLLSGSRILSIVDVETKESRQIPLALPEGAELAGAKWRPNDEMAAVMVEAEADDVSLYVVDLRNGDTRPLGMTFDWYFYSIDWLADGSALILNGAETGSSLVRIWLVDYPSGVRRPITPEGGDYEDARLSTDGTAIVAAQKNFRSEILVSSSEANRFTRIRSGTDVTYSLSWAEGKLVNSSNEAGSYDLYVSEPSTENPTRLTFDSTGDEFDPTTTPDGQTVVFVSYQDNRSSLWRIGVDGTGLRRLTNPIEGYRWMRPRISRDGANVIYMDWTSGPALSMVSIEGGESTPVRGWREGDPMDLREYAFGAGWSPDGIQIAFFHLKVAEEWMPIEIAISPLSGQITRTIPYTDSKIARVGDQQQLEWSADGKTLYFQRDGQLWSQPSSGGTANQVTNFDEPIGDYEWSKDGKILACTRRTELSDAVVIRGFR